MNDLEIDYFMAVATNLSFTKTSEELYVSQPAISRQIASLEKELGVTLFYRTNKTTELTKAGQLFYDYFREMRGGLLNAKVEAAKLDENSENNIRFGCLEGWNMTSWFPEAVEAFARKYPGAGISLSCLNTKELATALLRDNLEVILTFQDSVLRFKEFDFEDVVQRTKVLQYSSLHPLAGKEDLRPQDFRDEVFFVPVDEDMEAIRRIVIRSCRPYGFVPKIKYVDNPETMNASMQNGLGVCISDRWSWAQGFSATHAIDLKSSQMVSLAMKKGSRNEAAREFLNITRECILKRG